MLCNSNVGPGGRVDSEMLGQQGRSDGEMRAGRGPGGGPAPPVTTNRVEIEKERLGLSGPAPSSQSVLSGDEIVTQLALYEWECVVGTGSKTGRLAGGGRSEGTVTSVSCNTRTHQHGQARASNHNQTAIREIIIRPQTFYAVVPEH